MFCNPFVPSSEVTDLGMKSIKHIIVILSTNAIFCILDTCMCNGIHCANLITSVFKCQLGFL